MWNTSDDAFARQLGESKSANTALIDYTLMGAGERSLRKLCDQYRAHKAEGDDPPTVRLETLEDWSRKYRWQDRVAVYDAEQRAKRIAETRADVDGMNKRHIRIANALLARALLWINATEEIKDGPQEGTKVLKHELTKPSEVLAFIKLGADMERRARGMPTAVLELQSLTDDELLARHEQVLAALRADLADEDGSEP